MSDRPKREPWSVPRQWPNSTVVIVACGPSLRTTDLAAVRDWVAAEPHRHLIAINNSIELFPAAEVLYGCDEKWWDMYLPGLDVRQLQLLVGLQPNRHEEVLVLRNAGKTGLERDPTGLRTGSNSGHQAINLAYHLGARQILLLGYDMCRGDLGEWHWFGEYPPGSLRAHANLDHFAQLFGPIAAELEAEGVTVINCNPGSALLAFPKMSWAQAVGPYGDLVAGARAVAKITGASPLVYYVGRPETKGGEA